MSDARLLETAVVGNIYTNCYFLELGQTLIVIDPGGEPEILAEKIRKVKHDEMFLIATHCHFDHILAAAELQDQFGCRLLMHRNEKDVLGQAAELSKELFGISPEIPDCTYIGGGDLFDGVINVIETPGHTPGSVTLTTGDMMFTGDTLFRDSIGRTDFLGSYPVMKETLSSMFHMEEDYRVYPGHGDSTTLAREKKNNLLFRNFSGMD